MKWLKRGIIGGAIIAALAIGYCSPEKTPPKTEKNIPTEIYTSKPRENTPKTHNPKTQTTSIYPEQTLPYPC